MDDASTMVTVIIEGRRLLEELDITRRQPLIFQDPSSRFPEGRRRAGLFEIPRNNDSVDLHSGVGPGPISGRRKMFLQERNSFGTAHVPREFRVPRLGEAVMLGRGASMRTHAHTHVSCSPSFVILLSLLVVVVLVLFVGRGGSPSASNSPERVRSNVHAHNACLSHRDTGFASVGASITACATPYDQVSI